MGCNKKHHTVPFGPIHVPFRKLLACIVTFASTVTAQRWSHHPLMKKRALSIILIPKIALDVYFFSWEVYMMSTQGAWEQACSYIIRRFMTTIQSVAEGELTSEYINMQ